MIRRSTWIVVVLLVVLIGFTILFQRYQATKTVSTATPTANSTAAPVLLFNLNGAQIDRMKITSKSGQSIELYHDPASTNWAIRGTPVDQADAAQIASVSTQLSTLQAMETLTTTLSLASVGLDSPAYTITFTTTLGSNLSTFIGTPTTIGSGYYVRDEAGKLMIVNQTAIDDILNLLTKPPLLPTATPLMTPTETVPATESIVTATPTP